jgi:putative membrane protein
MLVRRIAVTLGLAGALLAPGAAAQADPDVSARDAAYLKAAHQVNLAGIEIGRIAWFKTTDPQMKDVAAAYMRDHIRLDGDVTDQARRLRVVLPETPTDEQRALAKRYQGTGGAAFEPLFVSTQLAANREALEQARGQAAQGDDPALKELAKRISPVLEQHQAQLRALD